MILYLSAFAIPSSEKGTLIADRLNSMAFQEYVRLSPLDVGEKTLS